MKISTLQYEAVVRVWLNLEILTLILKKQSAIFLGNRDLRNGVKFSGPIFDTLFMVRVIFRVICCYDVILNMSTAVRIKLQNVVWKFSPTIKQRCVNKKTHMFFVAFFKALTLIQNISTIIIYKTNIKILTYLVAIVSCPTIDSKGHELLWHKTYLINQSC